MSHLSVISH